MQDHVRAINETLGEHGLPMPVTLVAELQAAMKGKRSFASMQDAVDSVATNAKITASQTADRIRANIAILAEQPEYSTLFADRVALCSSKAPEDLRNLVATRIAEHQRAEQDRLDAEREKIRKEEADRLQRELEAAKAPEAAASSPAPPVVVDQKIEATHGGRTAAVLLRSSATVPSNVAPREAVKIKLGDINARIAPLTISADGLAKLGFNALPEKGAAKLYDETQFPAMCEAMSQVALNAAMKKAA